MYVKFLDKSVDDKALREHFAVCGKILSAKVMRYENGESKGFGFICFSSLADANAAVAKFNGNWYSISRLTMSYLFYLEFIHKTFHTQVPFSTISISMSQLLSARKIGNSSILPSRYQERVLHLLASHRCTIHLTAHRSITYL